MAWITPKQDWVPGDGIGFSDLNRIEGDLDYIYNFGLRPDVLSITSSAISLLKPVTINNQTLNMTSSAGWNESADLSLTMELSSPSSVYGARAYKYRAYISGDNEGQDLTFQNFYNNGTVWYDRLKIYSDGTIDLGISATFTSSAISLLKPVTITGALTVSGNINPTTTPTLSSFSATTTHQLIPRGIYIIKMAFDFNIEMQTSAGVWIDIAQLDSGIDSVKAFTAFSDGINFRYYTSSGTVVANYRKF